MSKEIPTIGKVWLIFLTVVQSIAIVTSVIAGFVNPLFFIAGVCEVLAVVSLIMLLLGKGLPFFITYCIGYGAGTIVAQLSGNTDSSTAFFAGTIVGLVINFALTYLAVKNTIKSK